jgi:hypothetical protein
VVAAGVPGAWLDDGGQITVRALPMYHGALDLRLRRSGRDVLVSVGGVEVPPGGIVLRPPLAGPLVSVEVDGRSSATFDADGATITTCPAEVVLRS